MNLVNFVQRIALEGWQLWVEGEKVRYRAPEEKITSSVLNKLKQNKAEILQLLSDRPEIANVYPLSHGQRALYFLWQLAPESHAYNAAFSFRISSMVDISAMKKSFEALIERHPILRTTFPQRKGEPISQVHQNQALDSWRIDATCWSDNELKAKLIEGHQFPFDLEKGNLMRVKLFTLSDREYVLSLTLHHIICDGWSVDLLLQELLELYQAKTTETEACLPTLKHSYQDYVSWQKSILEKTEGERLEKYWLQKLAGNLPVMNLPIDRSRSPIQTYNGASHYFQLSDSLTKQLKKLAQNSGVTIYVMLLATFQVLLYRYTGQEDILVGSPTSGRSKPEFTGIVGYFVDPVVMRADLSNNPSFKEFLIQVRQTVIEALTHQDYPFPLLVEKLAPRRDLSLSPIFQTSFTLQKFQKSQDIQNLFVNEIENDVDWGGLKLRPLEIPQQEGQFDLNLEMMEGNSCVFGTFKYNTDLFNGSTIERLASHFQNLLSSIVENPQVSVAELPLLSKAESHQLLVAWNDTEKEYPTEKCIHQLFEEQVKITPDAVAIVFENQQLTYKQLNQRANQLAHHLKSLGVGPEVLVGICVERSIEMMTGLLGILKAGGAYVPLDPNYPQERLSYIFADSSAEILLTQSSLLESLPENQARVVCLDSDWRAIEGSDQDNLAVRVGLDNLAYVIYTSGSTGIPKGVAIEHRSPVALCDWANQTFTASELSAVLAATSICFDLSIFELFVTLCLGGKVIIAHNVLDIINLDTAGEITLINTVPSAVAELLRIGGIPAKVRTVNLAGEPLPHQIVEQLYQHQNINRVYNLYGPSEDTTYSTFALVKKETIEPPSIGRPISNTQIYILDKHLQPLPIGLVGELYIGGDGLARGYLNRPKLTQEKFIPNFFKNSEFGIPNSEKLYKTGDLARYLSNGNIEFMGRIDHQVKVRGFRIELGEIDAVLNAHPQIQEAVVIATEDIFANKRLVAYIVNSEELLTTKQLRKFIKQKLPEYMVPSVFVTLDRLPLTLNGKVDRKALPAPDENFAREYEYVAPRKPREKIIAKIFAEVLNSHNVGIHDNFFDLGGHSLLAIQLLAHLNETFQIELPLTVLFENANVYDLTREIERLITEKDYAYEPIDLESEKLLDLDIQPSKASIQPVDKPQSIFLTGGTGFLGIYLLYELLEKTSATIYCLVRSFDVVSGRQKLESKLHSYNLLNESFISRIVPVVGNLASPLFGLSANEYDALAQKIDVIYHNGAVVNFLWSYNLLKKPNVLGTQEILRLASQVKIKPVHYISTVSVFPHSDKSQPILESDPLDNYQQLHGGYSQSKWVAEKLVWEAGNRGLPVSIYRPSRIIGHSQTGMSNFEDFVCRWVKGCILLKSAPILNNFQDNLVTVDYVSRAIVHLSRQNNSSGKAFHLINLESTPMSNIYHWIKLYGYSLEEINYDQWLSKLMNNPENPLHPLLSFFPQESSNFKWTEYDCHNVISGLAETDINMPQVDKKLFWNIVAYFNEKQFLALP